MNKYFLTSNLNFSWLCVKSCKRAEGMLTDEKANHRFKSHYALLSMQTMEIYFCASQWSVRSVCHKDYNNWTSLYKLAEVFFLSQMSSYCRIKKVFLLYTAFFSMLSIPKHVWRLKIASSKHLFVIQDYSASPKFFSKHRDFA